MWRRRPPTARRSCSRPTDRTSRTRSSRTGTSDALEGADVVARARVVQQRLAPGAHGDERDRGGARGRRRVHDLVLDAGAVRRPERSGRAARGRQEAGADRGARRRAAGSARSCIVYPEFAVVAAAAKALGRPVRWAETRSESMLNLNHGRAQVQRVEIGAKRDGTVVGMRVELLADMGAYPIGAFLPTTTQEMLVRRLHDPADRLARMERGHEHDAGRGLSRRGPTGGDGAGRARDGPDRGGARDGSGRRPTEEHDPAPTCSRTRPRPARRTTSGTTSARSTRRCGSRTCRSSARSRRRDAREATTCCSASACARTSRSPRSRRRSSARCRCTPTAS